jgi:pSer/pThr/pTyr-binding forkhead associated (FHA) protein
LVEQHIAGKKVLLIVDEAQNLSSRVLEEVRMLSGIETTKEKALRIILAGQPELNDKLNSQELVQLAQRVRLRFHLAALTKAETIAYIDHRLEVAGSQGRRIFEEGTYGTIYKYTGGTPRLINTLCDTCLMAAFGRSRDTVSKGDLEAAIQELRWVPFGKGVNRTQLPEPEAVLEPQQEPEAEPESEPEPAIPAKKPVQVQIQVPAKVAAEPISEAEVEPEVEPGEIAPVVGRILLASAGKTVLERELKPGRLVIGRTPDNDLQIDSKFVSRHHCQIVTQVDSCVIEDLNSTNGIFVQSKRVRQYNLNDGDVVQIGQHEIMYMDERAPRLRGEPDDEAEDE